MTQQSSAGIGAEIRARRLALGLSKEGLAYKAGVNLRTVERIEAGTVTPRRATVTVIEGALEREQAEVAA